MNKSDRILDELFIGRYESAKKIELNDHLLIDLQLKISPENIYSFTLTLKDIATENTITLESLGYNVEAAQIHVFFKDITIGPVTLKGIFQIFENESPHSRVIIFQGTLHYHLGIVNVMFYWKG